MKSMLKVDQRMHLDDATLRDLIRGLELDSLPEFQRQHFDTCADCQKRMELLVADSWWWNAYQSTEDELDFEPFKSKVAVSDIRKIRLKLRTRNALPVRRLEQYEIESLIGSGGMGVVYKAHDTNLDRTVAIKMLLPHLANQPGVRKQFLREARSAASISHEHVIDIFQVNASAKRPFLAMSWVPGETLESIVSREGVFSQLDVIRYALQIASALAEAHRLGVVHRDIKPANILLDVDAQKVVITDFGLAKTIEEASLDEPNLPSSRRRHPSR